MYDHFLGLSWRIFPVPPPRYLWSGCVLWSTPYSTPCGPFEWLWRRTWWGFERYKPSFFPAHSLPTYSFCVWHEIACLNICSWGSCINRIFADGAISPSDDSIIWGGRGERQWLHYSKEVVYDIDYVAFIYYLLCNYNPPSGDTDTFSWQPLVLGWWLCHRSLAAGVSRESSRTSTTQCSRASSGQKRWYLLSDQTSTW